MALVRVATTMSLDGYMAGPDHDMDWVFDYASDTPRDVVNEMIETTGSILAGRGSYDVGRGSTRKADQCALRRPVERPAARAHPRSAGRRGRPLDHVHLGRNQRRRRPVARGGGGPERPDLRREHRRPGDCGGP